MIRPENICILIGILSRFYLTFILVFRHTSNMILTIGFQYNDGGRNDAGFKGNTQDCVCRAVAIATGLSYADIYQVSTKHETFDAVRITTERN